MQTQISNPSAATDTRGRGPSWQGFEDDLIRPFLDVFPEEDRKKVASLTGRTINAVNVRWSKMRQEELQRKARAAAAGKEEAQQNQLKSAIVQPNKQQTFSLGQGEVPILEVNQAQKDLMDTICTVIHNVNGKYFILRVV
jgi:hypothetical protein